MSQSVKACFIALIVAMGFLAAFAFPVAADVELSSCTWQTIGTTVQFHLLFHNPDPVDPSGPVSGDLNTQPFGAFLPNNGHIGAFNIPTLAPDSFFDVFFDVELADLPPSAETIIPGGGGSGGSLRFPAVPPAGCPPNQFWAGNVDVFWTGAGGTGQANYHFGTLQICPGGPTSYIHVFGDCQEPGGVSWAFTPICPGWSVTLVSSDGFGQPNGPAPNPLPVGFFDGWICISADLSAAIGSTCCVDLNLTCGVQPATINICAEACAWEVLPTEESTWGKIKSMYEE